MEDIVKITLRSLQHYLYCSHRWGLIEIDKAWAENYFVVKANILHERVHSPNSYTKKDSTVYTEVEVWNDEWNIYGKLDCLECKKGNYTIVEYKPSKPKTGFFREEDIMQIYAQKLCVDSVFHCDCSAEIYYADVKKRYLIPMNECNDKYRLKLEEILAEMRGHLEKGSIPRKLVGQNCSGCSLQDLCIPKALKRRSKSIRNEINMLLEEEL